MFSKGRKSDAAAIADHIGRQTIPDKKQQQQQQKQHKWLRRRRSYGYPVLSFSRALFFFLFWRDVWPFARLTWPGPADLSTLILSVCPIRNDRIPDAHSSPQPAVAAWSDGISFSPQLGAILFSFFVCFYFSLCKGVGTRQHLPPPHTHTHTKHFNCSYVPRSRPNNNNKRKERKKKG